MHYLVEHVSCFSLFAIASSFICHRTRITRYLTRLLLEFRRYPTVRPLVGCLFGVVADATYSSTQSTTAGTSSPNGDACSLARGVRHRWGCPQGIRERTVRIPSVDVAAKLLTRGSSTGLQIDHGFLKGSTIGWHGRSMGRMERRTALHDVQTLLGEPPSDPFKPCNVGFHFFWRRVRTYNHQGQHL